MDIKIVRNDGKELVIEFQSKDMTFPDLVAHELQNDSDVSFAGVAKEHPEVGVPVLAIRTSKKSAVAALESALERIKENAKELKSAMSKKK
jgi:DNA-directed RNA polymerase subunit L